MKTPQKWRWPKIEEDKTKHEYDHKIDDGHKNENNPKKKKKTNQKNRWLKKNKIT